MRLSLRVAARASRNKIIRQGDGLKVYVTAPAVDGRANKSLIAMLADYFRVRKSQVKITTGEKSSRKIAEICR